MELVADTSTVNGSVTDIYNFSGLLQGLETAAGFDLDFSVLKKMRTEQYRHMIICRLISRLIWKT